MTKFITPDELHSAAKRMMLGGKEPKTAKEWNAVVNFWAANVNPKMCREVCDLMAMMYNCPLSPTYVAEVAAFQAERPTKE